MSKLQVISTSQSPAFEGGRQIRYVLDGQEVTIEGQNARNLIDEANASMGMLGDLPWVLVEYLKLEGDEQKVDAAWMTKEELVIYESSKKAKTE